jgi:glycosyltransferase involved in cell wall biosynthesis
MNIWMLNHYAHPPDSPGGTRHFDFARELVKQGHQVSIFASSFEHRTRKEERLTKNQCYRREEFNGVGFIWVRTFPYHKGNDWRRVLNMLSYSFRVVPLGLRLKETPDVILASSPHPFAGLSGWLLAKLKRTKFVFEVRDLWPQSLVEIGGYSNKSLVVKLLRVLEKFLYRRAKKIVVLPPNALEYIKKLGIPGDKVVHISNGVSPETFSRSEAGLPEALDKTIASLKSEGKLLVVYTGAHGIANALDTIMEAARLIQDRGIDKVHFLMVGEGPEKEGLMRKAKDWKLSNISFHEAIAKESIPVLLKASDIAVLSWRRSSLYEYGLSANKLWDYMFCAKPIAWAINTLADPVAETNCGLTVPAEDAEAMAQAIVKLSGLSDNERREMGKRGHDYVMKYQSVPVLAERLLEVMEEVKELR